MQDADTDSVGLLYLSCDYFRTTASILLQFLELKDEIFLLILIVLGLGCFVFFAANNYGVPFLFNVLVQCFAPK